MDIETREEPTREELERAGLMEGPAYRDFPEGSDGDDNGLASWLAEEAWNDADDVWAAE